MVKCDKRADGRGFGCDQSGAEVARRWVRRKNGPFSSRRAIDVERDRDSECGGDYDKRSPRARDARRALTRGARAGPA